MASAGEHPGAPRLPPALLVDYGMVISRAQPREVMAEIADICGLELTVLKERYWEHRDAYDLGASLQTYWSAVLGGAVRDESLLTRLSRLDVASWSEMNPDTLAVLEAARAHGSTLALLSNAPFDLAEMLSEHPALIGFEHRLFSSRLGVAKPEPAAFGAALDRLRHRPEAVLFIDDRPVNVKGALDVGMRGIRFTSAEQLRAEIFGS